MAEAVEVKEEDGASGEQQHNISLQQQRQTRQHQRRRSTLQNNYHNTSVVSLPSRVTKLTFFEPPYQRQRWGDTQILPHINWGDLFFDLFYVAAAYNLSYVLLYSPNAEGFLYLLGLFGPILLEWFQRTFFDARFAYGDDPFHHLFQVLHLCFLATAVVHIRPVETMHNPYKYPDMFGYSLGVLLIALCNIYRSIEIMFKVVGDETAAKTSERRYLVGYILQFICYLAASCVSGVALFQKTEFDVDATSDGQRNMMSISNVCSRILNSTQQRDLVDDSAFETNTPILLCFVGWVLSVFILLLRSFFFEEKDGGHKKHNVPMNIEYILHRFGELTMLLLGEGVLSVLIVETTRTLEYHVTFYAAIVSLILMQYMHFKYQPHSADEHAFRRSVKCGAIFYVFCIIHAFSLIGVGTAYKMMLKEYSENEKYRIRQLVSLVSRALAGGTGGVEYSSVELRQRAANMFCISMATSWLCLEGMYICHYGTKKYLSFMKCKWGKFVDFIRFCGIVIIATISQYVTEPEKVTLIGLALLCVAVATNEIGDYLWIKEFNKQNEHGHLPDETNKSGVEESGVDGKETQHDAEYCI